MVKKYKSTNVGHFPKTLRFNKRVYTFHASFMDETNWRSARSAANKEVVKLRQKGINARVVTSVTIGTTYKGKYIVGKFYRVYKSTKRRKK